MCKPSIKLAQLTVTIARIENIAVNKIVPPEALHKIYLKHCTKTYMSMYETYMSMYKTYMSKY